MPQHQRVMFLLKAG